MKVNIYLEWANNHKNIKLKNENSKHLLINCQTHRYNTFFLQFLSSYT